MRGYKRQTCEYHLTILNIRMKVKFPCRMKIEHMGSLVTGQAPISGDNKYIFNQEIILKDDQKQECFEFVVNLITEMGSKYIAGVIKLYHSQLVRSQSQKLVLSLSRCIDTQAFCQIRVDKVINQVFQNSRSKERKSSAKKSKMSFNHRQYFGVQSPKVGSYQQHINVGSRTQYEYPSANTPIPPRSSFYSKNSQNQRPQSFKSPLKIQDTMYQKTNLDQYESNRFQQDFDIEQLGYKQAYLNLKEKYKKETEQLKSQLNKKSMHQNNQNALKLELVKYKIKFQEMQRSNKEKHNKLQQSTASIHRIRQLQAQNNYLNSEIKRRDDQILRLEDTIQSLTCDLEEITESFRDKKNDEIMRMKDLKLNNQNLRQKLAQKQKELQYLRLDHQQIAKQKHEDFTYKNIQQQNDRKLILELQKNLQNKIIQSQKALQKEKVQSKERLQEELAKIEKLQKQITELIIERQQIKRKLSEIENIKAKEQYDRKLLISECESLRTQCLSLKQYSGKYYEILHQKKILNEKIIILQGQITKLVQSKNEGSFHLNKQFQDQIEYFRKLSKQSEEKSKSSIYRIAQLQNLVNQTKIQYERVRRNLQNANSQLNDIKQKELSTKRNMRQRENNNLKIQTEYATLKQKVSNIDQIYTAQIDKIKLELKVASQFLQVQKNNNAQINAKMKSLQNELKQKTQKLEQTLHKIVEEQKNNASNSTIIQQLRKNLQNKEKQFQKLNEHCMKFQKQQSLRLQEIEQDLKVKNQKFQRLKKDLKDVQQKYISQIYYVKSQTHEIQTLTELRAHYQQNLSQNAQKIKNLEVQLLSFQNQRSKVTKMNEYLQEQIDKCKKEIKQKNFQNQQSEKRQTDLKHLLMTAENERNQLSLKFSTFKKQFERFKQGLVDLDAKYITPLFKDDKESKLTLIQQTTLNQLLLSIAAQYKEIRNCFGKRQQQIALQKKENESLRGQIKKVSNQTQNLSKKMKQQIKQLQGQVQQIFYDKSVQAQNFTAIINQLKKKIEQKQHFEETLHNQIQQLNFNISSLKLDFQAANDLQTKKYTQIRKINSELQAKIKEKQILCETLQQNIEFQAQEIVQNNVTLQQFHEITTKQQKQIAQIKEILQLQRRQHAELQKVKKQLSQQVNELQFVLISTKQENEKNKKSLQDEERNSIKLNSLVNSLMKQKELGIKKQLESNQLVTDTENKLMQREEDLKILQQQYQKINSNYEGLKQTVKNVNSLNKQLQTEIKQLKSLNLKAQEKLTQKDTLYNSIEDGMRKTIQNYQKMLQKIKNQKIFLQQQSQTNKIRFEEQIKLACEKMSVLLIKLQQQKSQNQILQKKYVDIEEQMFEQHQKLTQQEQSLIEKQKQINQLKQKTQELDTCMNQLNEELRLKDQKLFGLSDQNYNLELRIQEEQKYRYEQLQKIDMENTARYQSMCEDYQNKIEILQNEAKSLRSQLEHLKSKMVRKELEVSRMQQQEVQFRKQNDQKFKRIEQDKSILLSQKNAQIQKLNEQIRHINETLKQKQTENRKILSQLQTLRKSMTSSEYKLREYEQKINNLLKQQRQESQQFRKKQSQFRVYKQSVQNSRWNIERQIKKLLQGYVRNFMQISDQTNTNKIIDTLRNLQTSIFEVLSHRQKEIK